MTAPSARQIMDYNNRLLINDGTGFFTDESCEPYDDSEMSRVRVRRGDASSRDINDDGVNDVVKQTSA